jgi:tetratricopeptide (TPR) repeat protein
MYLQWRHLAERWYTDADVDLSTMGILESKMEDTPEQESLLPLLYRIRGSRFAAERVEFGAAFRWYDLGISAARRHDDLVSLALLLGSKANLAKRNNLQQALGLLKSMKEICDEIGYKYGLSQYYHQLGHLAMARGEFESALQHQIRWEDLRKTLGNNIDPSVTVGMLHNMMGDGEPALAAMNSKLVGAFANPVRPMALIQAAWAEISLGRTADARANLTEATQLIYNTHDEVRLGPANMVEGLLEKSQGELMNARLELEKAADIFTRYSSLAFLSVTLLHMIDIEIEQFPFAELRRQEDLSGPWMAQMQQHVSDHDVPGFEAQLNVHRARFFSKQGRVQEAQGLLNQVLEASKSPGLAYLRSLIRHHFPEYPSGWIS